MVMMGEMKMNLKYSICVVAAALFTLTACHKEAPVSSDEVKGDFGEGMVFKAYASSLSKSHFEDADESDPDKKGTLYWDSSDVVGILSLYLHNEGEEFGTRFDDYGRSLKEGHSAGDYVCMDFSDYFTSALATVLPDDPAVSASLYSGKQMDEWFVRTQDHEEGKEAYYGFMGFYPMSTAPVPRLIEISGNNEEVIGVPTYVQPYQYAREGIGRYHVCMDCGIDLSVGEPTFGAYSMSEILNGTKVELDGFSPLTALLEFDIRSDREEPIELYYIVVREENRSIPLSGSAYSWTVGPYKYIFTTPSTGYNNEVQLMLYGYDDSCPEISTTVTDKKYGISVLPSYKSSAYGESYPSWCPRYGGETLVFEGYDKEYMKVFEARKTIPENGFEPGKRYTFTLDFKYNGALDDEIPGAFSVSSRSKVSFSRANLVRNPWSSQGQQSWALGRRPHDRAHWTGQLLSEGEFNWSLYTDLFGWATAGTENNAFGYGADSHHTSYLPWSYSTDARSYGPDETTLPFETSWTGNEAAEPYCEWGRNSTLVSLLGEGWRTLSLSEWQYLLFTRSASTVAGVSNARFIRGYLAGSFGLFIFSDDFGTNYTGSSFDGYDSGINNTESEGSAPWISLDEYYGMMPYGLAFLPASYMREGTSVIYMGPEYGWYWSSTSGDDDHEAYAMTFDTSAVETQALGRCLGLSVRLVRDLENNPDPNLGTEAGNAGSYIPGTL